MTRNSKKFSESEAKQKIYRYCAFQERSHQEVKDKLYEYGLTRDQVDQILSELITQGFLNEERFAKAFAGGKFRMKQWGRLKITHELELKGLTSNCIKSGLGEIEEDDYRNTLERVLRSKAETIDDTNPYVKRDKVAKYCIQKGYEPELVWRLIKELLVE